MIISHYSPSTHKESFKDIIFAGTSDDNSKILKLNRAYYNPEFFPRKFKKWPDTFSVIPISETEIKVTRTDVSKGGWGENLLIDVRHETPCLINELPVQTIPRVIYQTFETYEVPYGMGDSINSWRNSNPDYEHYFFESDDRIEFLKNYFDKDVLNSYLDLIPGAFKVDLWRCCLLYEKGGVYIDADMICLAPLNSFIEADDEFIVARDDPMAKSFLANGFIAAKPKHPFLKKQIEKIVSNVKERRKCFYLDISGPGLLGKAVNECCFLPSDAEFSLGKQSIQGFNVKILLHCWKTKTMQLDEKQLLLTEYPNKLSEMENIENPTFYSLVQKGQIYQEIPRNIYCTSRDYLALNGYMINSFKNKNQNWELKHYTDKDCIKFLIENERELYDLLGFNTAAFYQQHSNGGERSDFWRYCVIYLLGGVYTDTDTYCNNSLDSWVKHHDLILGFEAFLPFEEARQFSMDTIGQIVKNNVFSVCNWTFAAAPRHNFFKELILDIFNNPIGSNVLLHTGPGRITKHALRYFGEDAFSSANGEDIIKGNSILYSINRFGSNQSHSNAIKNYENPFEVDKKQAYIVHMFDGTWRGVQNKDIKLYKSKMGVSHNMTVTPNLNGYLGISRLDKDTTQTRFMEYIGDNRTLLEMTFDADMNLLSEKEKAISNYPLKAKFEDLRFFTYKNKTFLTVSYIDEDFNTRVGILDENYKFLGDVIIPNYNKVSWMNKTKIWEKNWLFLEKENELYFIYSTTPRYIVYKCKNFDKLLFEEHINIEWPLKTNVPENEVYFTANVGATTKVATGGSNNPIYLAEYKSWVYLIHTKIYSKRAYNHYAVVLNEDLIPSCLGTVPILSEYIPYSLLFVSSILEKGDHILVTGGVEDNSNFSWEISKRAFYKKAKLI